MWQEREDRSHSPINYQDARGPLIIDPLADIEEQPRFKLLSSLNFWSVLLILLVIAECGAVTGLTIYKSFFGPHATDDMRKFSVIVFVVLGFLVYITLESVLTENRFGLVVLFLATALLLASGTYSLIWLKAYRSVFGYTREGVIVFALVANTALSVLVFMKFGWHIMRKIGADLVLIAMFKTYQVWVSLLKLDLMLALTAVLFFGLFLNQSWELYVLIACLVINLGWALLGWVSVRKEWSAAFICFLILSFVEPGYVLTRAVSLFVVNPEYLSELNHDEQIWVWPMTVCAVLVVIVRLVFVVWSVRVVRNFGHGLREQVFLLE